MLILLVGLAFLTLSFSSYALAYQINGINRVVMCTPVSIFETSVFHNIGEDEHEILLSKRLVKSKLEKFYNVNCNSVEISSSAFLLYGYHYQRVVHYEVFKTINES